jgi:hypothetical protein
METDSSSSSEQKLSGERQRKKNNSTYLNTLELYFHCRLMGVERRCLQKNG